MALYMYQASYTAKSMAAQLKEPQDPVEDITAALEDVGAEIVVAAFPFGEYDLLVVYEAPDDMTAASVAMAVAAAGEVKSAKTTRLLSGAEWLESLRKRRVVGTRTGAGVGRAQPRVRQRAGAERAEQQLVIAVVDDDRAVALQGARAEGAVGDQEVGHDCRPVCGASVNPPTDQVAWPCSRSPAGCSPAPRRSGW